jgi:hypothetical protein
MLPPAPAAPQAPATQTGVLWPHDYLPPEASAIERPVPVKKTFWCYLKDSNAWQWTNADQASVELAPAWERHYESSRKTDDSEMARFLVVFPETTKPSSGGPW